MVNKMHKTLCAKISWAAFAVTAFMLSACTVGPNYHRPVVQTPTAFHGADESHQAAQTESFADLPWWQVFHDSQLQELIRTALKHNYDLQLAVERQCGQSSGGDRALQPVPAAFAQPHF
jgi:outer membrane protein TolC